MAKRTRVSVKEAKNLADSLYYLKFKHYGKLARVLIEAFAFEDADINAEWFVKEKLCTKGKFTPLREQLEKHGYLIFREGSKRYFVGQKLKPYLDKFKSQKTASLAQLDALHVKIDAVSESKADKSDVVEIKAQLADLAAKVAELLVPPFNEEKKTGLEQIGEKMRHLSSVK